MQSFLRCCSEGCGWGPKDVRAVQKKLDASGISSVQDLLALASSGLLNSRLEAAGQRRFTAETLFTLRLLADSVPGGDPLKDRQARRAPKHSASASAAVLRGSSGSGSRPSTSTLTVDSEDDEDPSSDDEEMWLGSKGGREAALLQRQVQQGLARIDAAAAEAHRRNVEAARGLAEVQADINRISERLAASKQRSKRPARSTQTPLPQLSPQVSSRPESNISSREGLMASTSSKSTPPGIGRSWQPSRSMPEAPCPRAAQSGFTFGLRPPPPPSRPDRGNQVQEVIRAQLFEARHQSEAEKKALFKRLMVKWHPDRNLDSVDIATSVFQYIQQQKTALGL